MEIVRRAGAFPLTASSTALRLWRAAHGLLLATEAVPVLLSRIAALLSAAEQRVQAIADLTVQAGVVTAGVDALRSEAGEVTARVDALRAYASGISAQAESLVQRADTMLERAEPMLAAVSEIDPDLIRGLTVLTGQLVPILELTASLNPGVADEAAELVHESLPLVRQMAAFLPLLEQMRQALPQVQEILEAVQRLEPVMVDVEKRIAGIPGAGFMLRRGEREIEERADTT